ncbi:hypothetical protein [Kaarinaea lacus]
MTANPKLLAIVEQGGYPNFKTLYQTCGYTVWIEHTMRKAMAVVRKEKPDVIVAEFNYQSDFRDRTSTLESLLATVERMQQTSAANTKVIVFYEKEYEHQLQKLQAMFNNFIAIAYPITEDELKQHLL